VTKSYDQGSTQVTMLTVTIRATSAFLQRATPGGQS
jgi:hypothetical protein